MRLRKTGFAALGFGLFFFIFFMPLNVQAHAPKDLDLEYDFTAQTLKVTIEHWAITPSVHFVEKIEIFKNGKRVEAKDYQNQPDPEKFIYTYKIEAADGDVLSIKATCSVFGTQTAKLKVKKPAEELKVIPAPAEEKKEAPAEEAK